MWRPGATLARGRSRRRRRRRHPPGSGSRRRPSGTGAPVKMRTASPGADRAREARGRRRCADDRAASPAPARRRPRARHSRPWRRRRRAAASRSAATSRGEHAPGAAASGTVSAATGRGDAGEQRASASATGSRLMASARASQAPERPPRLRQQPDAFDAHAAVDRLDHVVDRQAGDARRRSAPPSRRRSGPATFTSARHAHAGQRLVERRSRPRPCVSSSGMAERDQLVRALGRHDAGEARGAEHVALLGVAVADRAPASPAP